MMKQSGWILFLALVTVAAPSAYYLPKYMDISQALRVNSMAALAVSIRHSANIQHARYLDGHTGKKKPQRPEGAISNREVSLKDGYPAAEEIGIVAASRLPEVIEWHLAREDDEPNIIMFTHQRYGSPCYISYTEADVNRQRYTPEIRLVTTGC